MGDYVIIDNVLAPKGKEVMELVVPNPFSLCNKLSALLQTIFHGRGLNVFEDQLNWDTTSDPRGFYLSMRFENPLDVYTKGKVNIKINGKQPVDEKKPGPLFIEFTANIDTKFPASTPFQKIFLMPFLYLYNMAIYNKTRRRYIEIYKTYMEELQHEIRQSFGVPIKERLR